MKSVFANLIAIDEYADPEARLYGCKNDLANFRALLEHRCAEDTSLQLEQHTLIDSSATRANIIDSFAFFSDARDGDICVLYYCGHGSKIKAPPFLTNKKGWNETVVAHDSKPDGRNELIDKELAFLIKKTTEGKDLHFVVVMDCCHSGTNTRGKYMQSRILEPNPLSRPLESYLGFEQYQKVQLEGKAQYKIDPGPHLHLAAAKEHQTAKEVAFEGKRQGAFTYFLCKTLRGENPNISYANLISKVRLRLQQEIRDQSPSLEAVYADPKLLQGTFLSAAAPATRSVHHISYRAKAWHLTAGAIHGIEIGDQVRLNNDATRYGLQSVGPQSSILEKVSRRKLDRKQIYAAFVEKAARGISVYFSPEVPDEIRVECHKEIETNSDLAITDEGSLANFFIQHSNGYLALVEKDEVTPVFRPVALDGVSAIPYFVQCLQQLSNWQHVSSLSNPHTSIQEDELKITLLEVTDPGNLADDAPARELPMATDEHILRYQTKGMQQHEPAIKMSIGNMGVRPLWVSALYLGTGYDQDHNHPTKYCISNRFLRQERLRRGHVQWLLDRAEGQSYLTIPLRIEKELIEAGINEQKMIFKIIVSTVEFSTDEFNQTGVPWTASLWRQERSAGRKRQTWGTPDWRTFEIPLLVKYGE